MDAPVLGPPVLRHARVQVARQVLDPPSPRGIPEVDDLVAVPRERRRELRHRSRRAAQTMKQHDDVPLRHGRLRGRDLRRADPRQGREQDEDPSVRRTPAYSDVVGSIIVRIREIRSRESRPSGVLADGSSFGAIYTQ